MVVLTRKTDEGIVLDHDIVVRVLSIDGERVKLGITAPESILVLRGGTLRRRRRQAHHRPNRRDRAAAWVTAGAPAAQGAVATPPRVRDEQIRVAVGRPFSFLLPRAR